MLSLETATVREVDEAVEANLVAHMSWVQSRLPGARVESTPELVLVDSGLACDTFNFVCRARLGRDAAGRAAAARRFFDETGHPFSWWVGPPDEPADLGRALEAAGFVAAEPELGMVCDLARLSAPAPPGELRVARVESVDEVEAFSAVVAANWDPPDPLVVAYYRSAARLLVDPSSPLRLYAGYVDGRAVATAEVCVAAGVAGLYGVATLAAERRRGYATAVIARALGDARDEDVRVGALQSSDDGRHVYARMGFRPHGEYVEYQVR
jgi:GNAT superfamily N-acetyltransferase